MISDELLYEGATNPYSTTSTRGTYVVYISSRGIEFKTLKEAVIDDIKHQPFY